MDLTGRIDSFAPATGSEFALIPVENATGNFTKIAQRVPVRIRLDAQAAAALRPGLSVEARVDLRSRGVRHLPRRPWRERRRSPWDKFLSRPQPRPRPRQRPSVLSRPIDVMSDADLARADARPVPTGGTVAPASQPKVNWTALLLGFAGMVIGQFMAILDIQIVASSLPQIQAGVGASNDEISWIQTAYLIPEVVMIPLSGYLSRWWGTQKVFLLSCLGFMVMSVAVGLSTSIDQMIFFRAIQGFVGGAMIPTVFAVAFSAFPPRQRITASVIMGLIVTLAPTVGPTLGGHLTEQLSWHWLFFINVPPGLLVLFLVGRYGKFDEGDPNLAHGFDWLGLGLMAAFLMSLQFVLEEGAKNDWFSDDRILLLFVVTLVTGPLFIWRTLTYRNPIVELRAFANRNFTVGVAMTFTVGMVLFGGTFLLPLFLGRVRGYSAARWGPPWSSRVWRCF